MCLCLSSLKLSNWISSQKESRGWEWVYVNFHNVTTFAAKKAAEGRRWKGLFSAQDQTKKQQLWWWERRKQKWKGRFLTRWGMMTSTLPGDRRYVSVLWPLPASGNSCWIKPGCYFPLDLFHSFLLAGMDGRINLIISVAMLHGFTVATVEIKSRSDKFLNGINSCRLGFLIFFCYTAKIENILAVMQTWTR